MSGSGTTNPSKFLWRVFDTLTTRASQPLRFTYRAVGSSTGINEFANAEGKHGLAPYAPNTAFGSGDIPMPQEIYDNVTASGRTVLHIPFMIGAVSFFHSVPNLPLESTRGLNLTACLLGRIFSTDITTWDHPDILAINPGLAALNPAGKAIKVGHRTKGSSSTFAITSYMHAGCPEQWPADQVGSTAEWDDATTAVQGSGGMTDMLVNNEWAIGYIDSGHGQSAGLAEIELKNAAGNFVNSFDPANIQAAATQAVAQAKFPLEPSASFADADMFINMPGPNTWPICATSYIYVDKNLTSLGSSAPVLKAALEFILSEEGQELVSDYGFIGLPPALHSIATRAVEQLTLPADHPEWFYESSTDKELGSGPFVFSVKRNAALEYEVGQLEDAVAALTAQMQVMTAEMQGMAADMTAIKAGAHEGTTPANGGRAAEEEDDDSSSDSSSDAVAVALGAVGLVLAAIALVVAIFAKKQAGEAARAAPAGASEEVRNNGSKYGVNGTADAL